MKRTLLTLLLLSSLSGIGFSQTFQERVLKRIDNERKFDDAYFFEYCSKSELSGNNGEYVVKYYDLNFNGGDDLVAFFKPGNSLAEIVMVDEDEYQGYEFTYIDNDSDGIFDEKIENIGDTDFRYLFEKEFDKLKEKNENNIEKKEFEER
jgi:hypothetical protein